MRWSIGALSLLMTAAFSVSCSSEPQAELKAGRDVISFQKLGDGNYSVVCKDGLTETVSKGDLISNQVCEIDKYPYVLKSLEDTFLFSEDGEQDNCLIEAGQILRFGTQDQPLSVSEDHILFRVPQKAVGACALEKALVLKSHFRIGQHVGAKVVWDIDAPQEGVPGLFGDPETITTEASGSLKLGPVGDVVALSSGWILVGDKRVNKVLKINAMTGKIAEEYQLTVAPGRMVLDESTGILSVATRSANKLVRINLLRKTIESMPTPVPVIDLALAGQGRLFAIGNTDSFSSTIYLFDSQGQVVKEWAAERTPTLMAYDRSGKNLFVFNGLLKRYQFDEEALSLVAREEVNANNVASLALSADGTQLAAPAGGGNGNGYSIFDFNPKNLNEKNGEWNVGAYPTAATFFTQRDLFAAHNRESVKVFHKTTHALIKEIKIESRECDYSDAKTMAVSRPENLLFVIFQCGFDRDSGMVFWTKVD